MKEYRLEWCRYPYQQNNSRVIFVKADNPTNAMHIAQDHIERHFGIPKHDFGISTPNGGIHSYGKIEEVRPVPAGQVVGSK